MSAWWRFSSLPALVKNFKLTYDAPNEDNTFTAGDTITGTLTFTLTSDTKVKSVSVEAIGCASATWNAIEDNSLYSETRNYFTYKEAVVVDSSHGTMLSEGEHCHRFKFQIPPGDWPSSFKGCNGDITYMLEAKIFRSWKFPLIMRKKLKFRSKSLQIPSQCRVSGSAGKKKVEISATVDKKVCCPGDILSVVVDICNSSSKDIRPKLQLFQREIYRAEGSTTSSELSHGKIVEKYIAQNSQKTIFCQLRVPVDAVHSINNCEIITVEYFIRAYVDISFTTGPEVELPVVVIPNRFASQIHEAMGPDPSYTNSPLPAYPTGRYPVPTSPSAPFRPGQALGPYPDSPARAPSYSDSPPPAYSPGPYRAFFYSGQTMGPNLAEAVGGCDFPPPGSYPAPTDQDACGFPAPVHTQPAPLRSGFSDQWPQQPPPYGDPPAAFHPLAPSAQPQFQQGENPPDYFSINSPPTYQQHRHGGTIALRFDVQQI
ncbi:arrestin domain-containing protein 3-like [Cheilinus undulatus]|uniref:arrestin domain-containing protein 3-like n=1 Tax=Cheilinus undulatus TaxID=241271 RepID=UPI001BD62CFD|nr:arrestin domain-containing protein 3-like [Cheilinus undulatus]